jgi:hypothetical protein
MFAPLSEHIENKLDAAFCKKYSVYGTYETPMDWENYKESFARFLVDQFLEGTNNTDPREPRHPWDID